MKDGKSQGRHGAVVVALLAALLTTVLSITVNFATNEPAAVPGWLQPLRESPWLATLVVTGAIWLVWIWPWWSRAQGRRRPPTLRERRRLREHVAREVRRIWVKGMLQRSLTHGQLALTLIERPDAVMNPWGELSRSGTSDEQWPAGITIKQVADQLGPRLLILGDAGSGKTLLLLGFISDLLDERDGDQDAPVPVYFHLSSWARDRPPLAVWLADELSGPRYGVPGGRRLAEDAVSSGSIAPMLDGLDQVAAEHLDACVAAINEFRADHGDLPLVVCCHGQDYKPTVKLQLDAAVRVRPLTRGQVDQHVEEAGSALADLRALLQRDERLFQLLQTPLMLRIATLIYQGQHTDGISLIERPGNGDDRFLSAYVEKMLARPHAPPCHATTAIPRRRRQALVNVAGEAHGSPG